MTRPLDPGPPLTAGDEPCLDAPPTGGEYARAAVIAALASLVGAGGWFLTALVTHRLWGVVSVVIGVVVGMAVHQAAGRHRALALGAIAAAATLAASGVGYALLWLPIVPPAVNRQFTWYQLAVIAIGALISFLLAGPRTGPGDSNAA